MIGESASRSNSSDSSPNSSQQPDTIARWGGGILFAWALLAPLTIPLPGPGGVRLAISDVLGLGTLLLLPMFVIARGRSHRLVPLILLLGWALISTMANLDAFPSPVQAIFRVMRISFIMSPLALALIVGDDLGSRQRGAILNAYMAASLGGMVIGLVMNAIGFSVAEAQTYDFGRGQVARATGLMGDSSAYGHLGAAAVALVVCLLAVERRWSTIRFALCVAIMAVLPAFFYASLSRALLIDLAIVIVALIVLAATGAYDRAQIFSRIVGALVAATVLIGGLAALFPFEARTVVTRLDLDSFMEFGGDPGALVQRLGSGRSSVWSDSVALAQSNPVLGLGYKGLMTRYFIPGDNVFLTAFADLGVIGGLLVIGVIGLVAYQTLLAAFRAGKDDIIAAIAAPLWIGQVAHMLLLDVASYYSSFPMVLAIIGLAITAPRRKDHVLMNDWRWIAGQTKPPSARADR
jgi:hypothetical protein